VPSEASSISWGAINHYLAETNDNPLQEVDMRTKFFAGAPLAFMLGFVPTLLGETVARADIMPIGEASTAGFFQGSGTGETPRGWDFQVNAANVSVTQLGVAAATSGSITLTLWNNTTQTELTQVVENAVANTWTFAALGSAVPLVNGGSYSVIGWENTTESPWYLFNNTPPAAFNPTGTIQYLDTRFDNGIGANTFPGQTIPSPAQYGVTDIAYTTTAVPAPELGKSGGAFCATGIAVLAMLILRRRKGAAAAHCA
jgi:hypothetical protein